MTTGVATSHEMARYSSHRTDDNFLALRRDLIARVKVIDELRGRYQLNSGTIAKEFRFTIREGSVHNRHKGMNVNVISYIGGVSSI